MDNILTTFIIDFLSKGPIIAPSKVSYGKWAVQLPLTSFCLGTHFGEFYRPIQGRIMSLAWGFANLLLRYMEHLNMSTVTLMSSVWCLRCEVQCKLEIYSFNFSRAP